MMRQNHRDHLPTDLFYFGKKKSFAPSRSHMDHTLLVTYFTQQIMSPKGKTILGYESDFDLSGI